MPYRVLNYSFDVVSQAGDTQITNCQPTHIVVTVEIPPGGDAGSEFFNYASEQHETAANDGKGKIAVFAGQNVGESIQELTFSNGWIDNLSINASQADDKFIVSCVIAAAEITVSGVSFTHHTRAEHFS
jgi:hypothetical protein